MNDGFDSLCEARSLVRLQLVLVQIFIMAVVVKMNVVKMFTNILPSIIASFSMMLIWILPKAVSFTMQFVYIFICMLIYFSVIMLFREEREICFNLKSLIKRK